MDTAVKATQAKYAQTNYARINFSDKAVTADLVSLDLRLYSEKYLKSIQELLDPVMEKLGIYESGVQSDTNQLNIYVEDTAATDGINTFLAKSIDDFDKGAVNYICQKNTLQLRSTAVNGTIIGYKPFGFQKMGSIGFNAKDCWYQTYGLVTCGHVAATGVTQYTADGTAIGKPWYWDNGGNIDATFVRFEQNSWTPTYALSDGSSIMGYATALDCYVGANVKKYGSKTGYSEGKILAISETQDMRNPVTGEITHLTDLIKTSVYSEGGDSGGPLLTSTSNLLGILEGGPDNDYNTTYFVKAHNIMFQYHLKIVSQIGTSTPSGNPLLGDVDGTEYIDTTDATMVLQYSTGKITLTGGAKIAADVDWDGIVDTTDARIILQNIW